MAHDQRNGIRQGNLPIFGFVFLPPLSATFDLTKSFVDKMWGFIEENPDLQTNGPTKTKQLFQDQMAKDFGFAFII